MHTCINICMFASVSLSLYDALFRLPPKLPKWQSKCNLSELKYESLVLPKVTYKEWLKIFKGIHYSTINSYRQKEESLCV